MFLPSHYHSNQILKLVHVRAIKTRHFFVALDTVNGAGGTIALALLKKLGCQVAGINLKMNGLFAHMPEPTPANLKKLADCTRQRDAHIGFALDPDADRLVLASPARGVLSEEYTVALVVNHHLQNIKRGTVVINQSTSRMSEDIARENKCRLVRAPVGEVNVVEMMIQNKAVIGGEGNGGVIDPRLHLGRDGLMGMALILEYLALSDKTIDELVDTLPRYEMIKDKIPLGDHTFSAIAKNCRAYFARAERMETDGIRFAFKKSWLHIRPSNTEPIIRFFAESPTVKESKRLIDTAKKLIE